MKKRNLSVDVAKLFACLIVILCHLNFRLPNNSSSEWFHTFLSCATADGVAMFFLITGFYFFQNKSYKTLLIKTFKKIFLPGFFMLAFYHYFYDYFILDIPFQESNVFSFSSTKSFLISVFTFQETQVYWYIFSYILIVILFPILNLVYQFLEKRTIYQVLFIILSITSLILNDILGNSFLQFGYSFPSVILPCAIYVLFGAILFLQKETWFSHFRITYGILFFFISNLIRTSLYLKLSIQEIPNNLINYYSIFGYLSAILIVFGILKSCPTSSQTKGAQTVLFLSKYTYEIYLIHPFVIEVLNKYHFFEYMGTTKLNTLPGPIYLTLIGLISFAIVIGITLFSFILILCFKKFLIRLFCSRKVE